MSATGRRPVQLYRGVGRKQNPWRAFYTGTDGPNGSSLCPVCGFSIGLRDDGRLRAHKVGFHYREAIPCPGGQDVIA